MAGDDFGARLRALREDRKLSLQRLSRALYDADGAPYDASFIHRVEHGGKNPPLRFLLLVGQVLQPTLEELPEYHLAQARRLLDEREVGLEEALTNLSGVEGRLSVSDARLVRDEGDAALRDFGERVAKAERRGSEDGAAPDGEPKRAGGGRSKRRRAR